MSTHTGMCSRTACWTSLSRPDYFKATARSREDQFETRARRHWGQGKASPEQLPKKNQNCLSIKGRPPTNTIHRHTFCATIGLPPLICRPKSAPRSATLGPPRSVPWTGSLCPSPSVSLLVQRSHSCRQYVSTMVSCDLDLDPMSTCNCQLCWFIAVIRYSQKVLIIVVTW